MNETTTVTYVLGEIEKLRLDKANFIAEGRAADHAEYRHVCGQIRGLALAEQLCRDLVRRLEHEDE